MSARPSLEDYIDVAERIVAFKEQHPEGSLQTIGWEVVHVDGKPYIVYHAAAYRTPDDERPGHGIAWEPFPGATPYTKNSELMNAETAAWGRAIVAVGITANRKLASRQEVKARMAEQEQNGNGHDEIREADAPMSDDTRDELRAVYARVKPSDEDFRIRLGQLGVPLAASADLGTLINSLTEVQATWLILSLDKGAEIPEEVAT